MNQQYGLASIAQQMASRGRDYGNTGERDSMLVHMAPREVAGLQQLALANGGSLTINPETGLYEAGFLKKLLPLIAGFALNTLLPGIGTAVSSALRVGSLGVATGTATAIGTGITVGAVTGLSTGSLKKGLMAGLGAFGGANLAASLGAVGSGTTAAQEAAQEAAKKAVQENLGLGPVVSPTTVSDAVNASGGAAYNSAFSGAPVAPTPIAQVAEATSPVPQQTAAQRFYAQTVPERFADIGTGVKRTFADEGGLSTLTTEFGKEIGDPSRSTLGNKIGRYATYAGLATPLLGMDEEGISPPEDSTEYYISGGRNPKYGSSINEPYFLPGYRSNTYKPPGTPRYSAAQGGTVPYSYAEGGDVDPRQFNLGPPMEPQIYPQTYPQDVPLKSVNVDPRAESKKYYESLLAPPAAPRSTENLESFLTKLDADVKKPKYYDSGFLTKEDAGNTGNTGSTGSTGGGGGLPAGARPNTMGGFPNLPSVYDSDGNLIDTGYIDGLTTKPWWQRGLDNKVANRTASDARAALVRNKDIATGGGSTGSGTGPTGGGGGTDEPNYSDLQSGSNDLEDFYRNLANRNYAPPPQEVRQAVYEPSYNERPEYQTYAPPPQEVPQDYFYQAPQLQNDDYYRNLIESVQEQPRQEVRQAVYEPSYNERPEYQTYVPPPQEDYSRFQLPEQPRQEAFQAPQDYFSQAPQNPYADYMPQEDYSRFQLPEQPRQEAQIAQDDYRDYFDRYGMAAYAGGGLAGMQQQMPTQQQMPMQQQMPQQMPMQQFLNNAESDNLNFGFNQGGYIGYAGGGLPSLQYAAAGKLLNGSGDGMSDSIHANISGRQEARLADGEFVVPADVVSHLGNGSTKAGAKKLYAMMSKVREARTGKSKQAPAINASRYLS